MATLGFELRTQTSRIVANVD